jgi:hypothetical protein
VPEPDVFLTPGSGVLFLDDEHSLTFSVRTRQAKISPFRM